MCTRRSRKISKLKVAYFIFHRFSWAFTQRFKINARFVKSYVAPSKKKSCFRFDPYKLRIKHRITYGNLSNGSVHPRTLSPGPPRETTTRMEKRRGWKREGCPAWNNIHQVMWTKKRREEKRREEKGLEKETEGDKGYVAPCILRKIHRVWLIL